MYGKLNYLLIFFVSQSGFASFRITLIKEEKRRGEFKDGNAFR